MICISFQIIDVLWSEGQNCGLEFFKIKLLSLNYMQLWLLCGSS